MSDGSGQIFPPTRNHEDTNSGVAKIGDAVDLEDAAMPSGRCCAAAAGFSVHAGICVPARDRARLERLARYAGRPPLATERLSLLPDGRLLYRLKHRRRDATSHVIYESIELVEFRGQATQSPNLEMQVFENPLD
jgi:hypothetical protein